MSYRLLHGVATRLRPVMQTGRQFNDALPLMLWQGFATGGQYLVPFICRKGALAPLLRRRRRRALFDQTTQATGADALQGMSWQEFEMLVGEGFKRRGYGLRRTGGGGADLVLTKGSQKFFVQCKQRKAFKVGVTTVRELYGVMTAEGATGGFVVTSGRFTNEACAVAAGRNVELKEGDGLMQLLGEGRANKAARSHLDTARTTHDSTGPAWPRATVALKPPPQSPVNHLKPDCPRCASRTKGPGLRPLIGGRRVKA